MTVYVFLSPAEQDRARTWSDTIIGTGVDARPNPMGFQANPRRYEIGYWGELAVCRWLIGLGAVHEHRVCLTGRSAPPEITIGLCGAPATVEVKCASKADAPYLLVPARAPFDADVYISTRIHDWDAGMVELNGWMTRDQIGLCPLWQFGRGRPTRKADLDRLRPMDKLARRLTLHRPGTADVPGAVLVERVDAANAPTWGRE